MQFLLDELNDPSAVPCGRCASCRKFGFPTAIRPEILGQATAFLNSLELIINPHNRWPKGSTFEGNRGKIELGLRNETGRALCFWGDGDFGEQVREGKQITGQFSDRLLGASVRVIREAWRPQPPPSWVTCVSSLRHRTLVPEFTARLAHRLGLPFVLCIDRIRETEPQKAQHNSISQIRNLEGTFAIRKDKVQPGPVLLVDDVVDSRWTFTALGCKLRQAGSGPVFPFSLADASRSDAS